VLVEDRYQPVARSFQDSPFMPRVRMSDELAAESIRDEIISSSYASLG
jgi:hypothetical protein